MGVQHTDLIARLLQSLVCSVCLLWKGVMFVNGSGIV